MAHLVGILPIEAHSYSTLVDLGLQGSLTDDIIQSLQVGVTNKYPTREGHVPFQLVLPQLSSQRRQREREQENSSARYSTVELQYADSVSELNRADLERELSVTPEPNTPPTMALSTAGPGNAAASGTAASGTTATTSGTASSATAPGTLGVAATSSTHGSLNNRPSWRTSNNGQSSSGPASASASPSLGHAIVNKAQLPPSAQTSAVSQGPSTNEGPSSLNSTSGEARNTPISSATPTPPNIYILPDVVSAAENTRAENPTTDQVAKRTMWAAQKCLEAIRMLDRNGKLKFLEDRMLPVPDTPEPPLICRAMMMSITDHLRPLFRMVLQVLTESGMSSETAVEGINKYLVSIEIFGRKC